MATEKPTPTTPSTQSQSAMTFGPAPENVRKISGAIDAKVASTLRSIVDANGTVTNSRVYADTTDKQYRLDRNYMRKHLNATLDTTQRVKITNFGDPSVGVSFYLSIATRRTRAKNGEGKKVATKAA